MRSWDAFQCYFVLLLFENTFSTSVSMFSIFSSGIPEIFEQFLLEYCSISSSLVESSRISERRPAIYGTNIPARTVLKFSFWSIKATACVIEFSSKDSESRISLNLLRSLERTRLLSSLNLLCGLISSTDTADDSGWSDIFLLFDIVCVSIVKENTRKQNKTLCGEMEFTMADTLGRAEWTVTQDSQKVSRFFKITLHTRMLVCCISDLTTTIGHIFFIEITRNHSKQNIFKEAKKQHSHLHDYIHFTDYNIKVTVLTMYNRQSLFRLLQIRNFRSNVKLI